MPSFKVIYKKCRKQFNRQFPTYESFEVFYSATHDDIPCNLDEIYDVVTCYNLQNLKDDKCKLYKILSYIEYTSEGPSAYIRFKGKDGDAVFTIYLKQNHIIFDYAFQKSRF